MKDFKKKQHILMASAALLQKEGVQKVSMQDIAKFAAVSKVTIYKYFGDKNGLFCGICAWLTSRCAAQIREQAGRDDANPAVRMRNFVQIISDFIGNGEMTLCRELAKTGGQAAADYSRFENAMRDMVFALIREGKQAGLIDPTLEDGLIYHYIDMGFCYFESSAAYREKMRSDNRFRESFLNLIWRNVFKEYPEQNQDLSSGGV